MARYPAQVPRAQSSGSGVGDVHTSTLRDRLSRFLLKPQAAPSKPPKPAPRRSIEELEENQRYADDKERLWGLIAAPVAAAIAVFITSAQISHDAKHTSIYTELLWVLLALSVVMLATAWFRKRLFLGCAAALYGLAVFNLHWWGFGVPFVLFGAWLLVRAYRAQRDLKEATASAQGSGRGVRAAGVAGPDASKRYTPPSARRRRPSGVGEKKAG